MNGIGLARPAVLVLLAFLPLLALLVVRSVRARDAALRTFAGGASLSARSRTGLWVKNALLLLALAAVVVALAGPYVDLRTRGARRLGSDLVLAIDVSQSMATRDVAPDRLRTARHVAQALGERMLGSRLSLVLFAGDGTVRYPATTDPRIVGEVLDNSGRGVHLEQGTSVAAALQSALGAFPAEDGGRGRGIVLVSDGEVTLGPSADAASLAERGIALYTIGVGTPAGGQIPTYDAATGNFTGYLKGRDGQPVISRLDEDGLRQLAASGGGRYWRYAGDDAVVDELAAKLRSLEATVPVDDAGTIPDERSQLFIAIAVAALLVDRFLPDRRRMPPLRSPAAAARPRRRLLGSLIALSLLWAAACGSDASSALDRANADYAAGRYGDALAVYQSLEASSPPSAELAIDAGNALHMLGEHGRALPEYAHAIDLAPPDVRAIAQYDRGNTLFRLGRFADARDAYREALRLDPNDRDAKFNLELLERLVAAGSGTRSPGQSTAPRASGKPSGGEGSNGPAAPGGSPQPGARTGQPTDDRSAPANDRAPGDTRPEDLRNALRDFRQGLTIDDALRVLDALSAQERGIAQLLEGPRDPNGAQY